jgi:hypothetical protein
MIGDYSPLACLRLASGRAELPLSVAVAQNCTTSVDGAIGNADLGFACMAYTFAVRFFAPESMVLCRGRLC